MSTWTWISGKREREVLLHSIEHLNKVREVAFHMKNMIDYVKKGDYSRAAGEYRAIFQTEREADELKRKLIDELSKGVFHPLDREDLLRLVLTSDDIASYIKASGKKLEIVIENKFRVPEEFLEYYDFTINEIVKAIDYIIESIKTLPSSINKTLEYTHKVEEIEEKIDEFRYEILKKIAGKHSGGLNIYHLLLKEAIDDLEMASDKCEDTCDIIRTIAISHS